MQAALVKVLSCPSLTYHCLDFSLILLAGLTSCHCCEISSMETNSHSILEPFPSPSMKFLGNFPFLCSPLF